MEMKIEKGVPIPTSASAGLTALLRRMKVWDSAVVPKNSVFIYSTAVQLFGGGGHVTVRKIDGNFCRVWRIK